MCLPLQGSFLSNTKRGNMAVQLDLETGVMNKGAIYSLNDLTMPALTHDRVPGFDAPFEGVTIPHFASGMDAVLTAHAKVLYNCEYIGWDFCITEDGIKLIECNTLCSTSYFGDALPRLTNKVLVDNMLRRFEHISYPW